jgi:hypothetical protein
VSDSAISDEVEKLLFTKLLAQDDPSEYDGLIEKGLSEEIISTPYKPVFTLIHDYRNSYGTLPELSDVIRRIPDITGLLTKEKPKASLLALYDEHINQRLRSDAYSHLAEIADDWNSQASGMDILEKITSAGQALHSKFARTRNEVFSMEEMGSLLRSDYDRLQEDISPGIPIPFAFLQEEMRGWSPAEITTIVSKTGVGKTWFLLLCADAAAHGDPHRQHRYEDTPAFTDLMRSEHSASVLIASLEMPAIALARRLAAIIAKISFPRVRSGKLSDAERIEYFKYLESLTEGDSKEAQIGKKIFIVGPGAATTPDQIAALAEKYGVDLVMIDGFYYMEGPGEKRWEKVEANMQTMRLQTLTSNRHYVLATQFRTEAKTLASSGTDSLAFSQSIGHDSNNIIALVQPGAMKAAHQLQMVLIKIRDGNPGQPYRFMWNVDTMDYKQLGMVAEAEFGSSGSQY